MKIILDKEKSSLMTKYTVFLYEKKNHEEYHCLFIFFPII